MDASYAALVGHRPARRLLYALATTTLSYGMLSLTVLLTVERSTGSYRTAGFAVAAWALMAAVSAPFRGRLIDRGGARIWLPAMACGFAGFLVALDLAAHGGAPGWSLVLLAAGSGLSAPPIFASARSLWVHVVEPELVRRGYALMSLLYDAGQIVGPIVAAAFFLFSSWPAAFVCGAFAICGALLSLPARRQIDADVTPVPMPSLLSSPALAGLLAVSILFGGSQGVVQVAVPAATAHWHQASLAGVLLAAFAAGSVTGALWYGSRVWHLSAFDRYLRAVLLVGLLLIPAVFADNPAELGVVLFFTGMAFGPATVALFETLDVLVPGTGAESLTWVTTAEAAGSAAGSALAGVLSSHGNVEVAFGVAATGAGVAALAGLLLRRARR
jgi:MFS family permease